MEVASILTADPLSLPPEATLEAAMNLMDEHDFRHLPVVSGGRLVGIVSNRDLLEASGWMRNGVWHSTGNHAARHLGAIMHPSPATLTPGDSVVAAALEMTLRRVGCLPVLDKGRLVGIVTETDLARAYVREAEAGRVKGDVDPQVSTLMTSNAMTVQVDTTLEEASELCRTTGVRHLPVADGERVVGILSDRALRKAVGARREPSTAVRELMAADPVSVAPHQLLSVAARRMLDYKISALPVIQGERLVGILTLTDVLEHCLGALRDPGP